MADQFDPDGNDFDYRTAKKAGMKPVEVDGEMKWGSVVPVSAQEREKYGLPDEAYVVLKGRRHKTWDSTVDGENKRGFSIVKLGGRYYSVPQDWTFEK